MIVGQPELARRRATAWPSPPLPPTTMAAPSGKEGPPGPKFIEILLRPACCRDCVAPVWRPRVDMTIRVGIIGANASRGWSAATHLPALAALEDFSLEAMCTTRAESARE